MDEFLYHEMRYFMPPCCLVLIRLTFFISEPDKVHCQSRVANDSTSWDRQACTHNTLWRQHYITTSKEYLTNSRILLTFWIRISSVTSVKNSRKLVIIWVNYEKKKKGTFYETPCRSTLYTVFHKKTFCFFIIYSNDDRFTQNFYQL